MARTTGQKGERDRSSSARTGVTREPRRSRFEPSCDEGELASFAKLAAKVIGGDSVRRWRFEQLERGGYPTADALVLSGRSDVDLHQAIRLLNDRCPVPAALRILI
jgi:hypothetical protein